MVAVKTILSNGETTSSIGKTARKTTISKIGDRQLLIGKIRNPYGISKETIILRNLAKILQLLQQILTHTLTMLVSSSTTSTTSSTLYPKLSAELHSSTTHDAASADGTHHSNASILVTPL